MVDMSEKVDSISAIKTAVRIAAHLDLAIKSQTKKMILLAADHPSHFRGIG